MSTYDFDIEDFLPKYPNINKNMDDLFNPYPDTTFETAIYKKKEFYENKLQRYEDIPQDDLLQHQKIIAKFLSSHTPYDGLLLAHEMGCLDPATIIPLYRGGTKRADEIVRGDILIGDDGTPRNVLSTVNGITEMYKVVQENGMDYIVNGKHILTFKTDIRLKWNEANSEWLLSYIDPDTLTIKNIIKNCIDENLTKSTAKIWIQGFIENIKSTDICVTVNKYIQLSSKVKSYLYGYKCPNIKWNRQEITINPYLYSTTLCSKILDGNGSTIDEIYVFNDLQIRRALLAGFIDVSGNIVNNNVYLYIPSGYTALLQQLTYVAKSIGLMSSVKQDNDMDIVILSGDFTQIPTIILDTEDITTTSTLSPIVSIKYEKIGPYYGWQLDGNCRFLLQDFTVTHNTGKTCSAVSVAEQVYGNRYKNILIIAPGKNLLNNFIQEIAFKCTNGKYIPDEYYGVRNRVKQMKLLRNVLKKAGYQFMTYYGFAKNISDLTMKKDGPDKYRVVRDRYSNSVIIMDEIHHIHSREEDARTNKFIYENIYNLCHNIENKKILLLSGTPVRDSPYEIADIMNLILPMNNQIPTGKDFPMTKTQLAPFFKGRVSVLKTVLSDIDRKFVGKKLNTFVLDYSRMEDTQFQGYREAFLRDTSEGQGKGGFFTHSRQAILFSYRDGDNEYYYGNKFFDKYIIRTEALQLQKSSKKIYTYKLEKNIQQHLLKNTQNNDNLIIKNIKKYSSKYAHIIDQILNNKNKNMYIYSESVTGCGLILFSKLLELFGYKRATGKENSKAPRYALITHLTSSPTEINNIKELFNSPTNMYGEYIQVILGSGITTEGFSLKNIQQEHIITPNWNYAPISQAIARGLRTGSHKDLIDAGVTPVVELFQHAAKLPKNVGKDIFSIDIHMYKISEKKDVAIKTLEFIMKQASFDCGLTYNRNRVLGSQDGTRDCDYNVCNYTCDGIDMDIVNNDLSKDELDFTTYNLFYIDKTRDDIIKHIHNMYLHGFCYTLSDIFQQLQQYSSFEIITVLRDIIDNNIHIYNKYGFPSYLREEDNKYFLINSPANTDKFLAIQYVKNPVIVDPSSYETLSVDVYNNSMVKIVQNLDKISDYDEYKDIIAMLPDKIIEILIEASVIAKIKNSVVAVRDFILQDFADFIKIQNNMYVSSYPQKYNFPMRCLDISSPNPTWKDCKSDMLETITTTQKQLQDNIINNPYGYYAIINTKKGTFSIVNKKIETDTDDKRKKSRGMACTSWKRPTLIAMIANDIPLPIPEEFVPSDDRDMLISKILKKYNNKEALNNMDINTLNRVYYWAYKNTDIICQDLKRWFMENNLAIIE